MTIYPAGNNRFRSVAEELKIMAVKDSQAIVIKTFVSVSQRIRIIYLESWRDRKPVLFAIKDVTSPYRQLSVYIQMPKTAENLDLIKRMLETVEVDRAYMAEPYKQSY
ncbi:hypothetical protein [Hymenobacter rigui]|uniref:Uncharacterized protein n=1 Tax=Hymenobacter rigui TaxID=334424 RepID=A0A428KMZ5_9BACT|nr:hypothetical protein [Hymenobacter rigui]RSK47762.1 hypothetical protein EI291_14280 [Hymenobacter rigui]